MTSETHGIILNILGCAYLTYTIITMKKKAGGIFLLSVSALLGILASVADLQEAHLFPFSIAVFHFLFRFLWFLLVQTRKNIRSMAQPLKYEKEEGPSHGETPAHTERQVT